MTVVQGVRSRRRYISSFSVSDINRRCLDAWSLERAAFKIYRSIKMIARRAAASETAFRGFISRRCIKHVQQQAGSRRAQLDHDSRGGGDLFTWRAIHHFSHRQPEMNGLFARCFHDIRLPGNEIFPSFRFSQYASFAINLTRSVFKDGMRFMNNNCRQFQIYLVTRNRQLHKEIKFWRKPRL